jgi:predicted phosphodiesterase
LSTRAEIAQNLNGIEDSVIVCGHSHQQRLVRLADGKLLVNPGSVGLPAYVDDLPVPHVSQACSPHARYAVLSRRGKKWDIQFKAIDYDWDKAAQIAEDRSMADWAHALRTGFVPDVRD